MREAFPADETEPPPTAGSAPADRSVGVAGLKLVFIYGPPAAGKLTVAKEVSRLTGIRVFHNRVAIDFACSVFEFGTPGFWRLVHAARTAMFAEAARERVDVIFTFVYGGEGDDRFVRKAVRTVESRGGEVGFVRLRCSRRALLERVGARGRKSMGKLATKGDLRKLFEDHQIESGISYVESLTIDTDRVSPRVAAIKVVQELGLRRVR